jgi:hypothetical protein
MDTIRLDATATEDLLLCSMRYEFRMIKKVVPLLGEELFLGGTVHSAMDQFDNERLKTGKIGALDDLIGYYAQSFNDRTSCIDYYSGEKRNIEWKHTPGVILDEGVEVLRAYYPHLIKRVPLMVEWSWEKEIEPGVMLFGKIDKVDTDGIPIDYKVVKRAAYQTDLDRKLQPTFYSFASGGPVRKYEYHYIEKTRVPKVIQKSTSRTVSDLEKFKVIINKTVKFIRAGNFYPNTMGWWCSQAWCSFYDICPVKTEYTSIEE